MHLERYDEAFSLLEKIVVTNSDDEYLQSSMAFILYNLGKYDDAKSYLEKALEINANLTDILEEKELIAFNELMNNNTK